MINKKIAIVGAGVGGLATAARLGKRGHQVEVFEKLPCCGGRNNLLEDRGFKFDLGPSFVLMPDFFKELFTYCQEEISEYLNLQVLDPSYKIFYPDGDSLTIYQDSEKTKQELEKIEPGAAAGFDRFIEQTRRFYNLVQPLLYKCFAARSAFNPGYWPLVYQIKFWQSYWQLAKRFFKSDKLCYAFTFEAMFMGVSPFVAPAFYSIISYADHVQKIYHPLGGMYQIPRALQAMGEKFGVNFNYNLEIKDIAARKNSCVLAADQLEKEFDQVVVNADYAYAQTDLLKRKIPDYRYSCSTFLLYLGLKTKIKHLAHHNLFFARDLTQNLEQIFNRKIIPEDPSFYVHVPTVTDTSLVHPGKDILYLLIPVPNLKNAQQDPGSHEQKLKKVVYDQISRITGENLEELIEVEHKFYPQDFISRYNIKYGATFGLAHNLLQSGFFRPANFDSRSNNLYFVGASTQPGGGLPVVIASSRIVADLVNHRLGG